MEYDTKLQYTMSKEEDGIDSRITVEGVTDGSLYSVAQQVLTFVNAAGYSYVDEVVFVKQKGGEVSSNPNVSFKGL
mgnify:FL=1